MKLKFKLSGSAIKGLFTNHVEKLLLGVAMGVMLWFVYGLTGLTSLSANQQPDRLQANARQKTTEIDSSEPGADVAPVFQPVTPRAKPLEVRLADYASTHAWDAPLKEAYAKRTLPPLLPVESLRVSAGTGSFATTNQKLQTKKPGATAIDEDSARRQQSGRSARRSVSEMDQTGYVPRLNADELKAKGFVIIVGKAPYKKQIDAYDKVLRLAEGASPEGDRPEWLGVEVERAAIESAAAADPQAIQWEKVDLRALQQFMDAWPKSMDEVVAEEYTDARSGSEPSVEQIAAPLAPLVGENWGLRAAHPDFPLSRRMAEALARSADEEQSVEPTPPPSAEPKTEDAATAETAPPPADDEESGTPSKRSGVKGQVLREPSGPTQAPDYKLFRFIDYSAVPGKTYVYRVRLRLANPNYQVAARYLENPELAKAKSVMTAWSEVTPPIKVPQPAGVLAGAMKEINEKGKQKQLLPHLMLYTLDSKTGRQVGGELPLERGLLANVKLVGSWVDPSDNNLYELRDKAEFKTDALVLDYQGGRARGRGTEKSYEPLAVLVRNADGQLAVRLEADDSDTVSRFALPPEPAESSSTDSTKKPATGKGKGKDAKEEVAPRRPGRSRE